MFRLLSHHTSPRRGTGICRLLAICLGTAAILPSVSGQDPIPPASPPPSPAPPAAPPPAASPPESAPAPAPSEGTTPAGDWKSPPSPAEILTKIPRVWMFNGLPGDDEHHEFHEACLASLKTSFTTRFGVPADRITVLYGPKSAGYDGACTAEALRSELAKIVAFSKQPDASPVWIIFQGHANSIPSGSLFNIPGPDLSARDIAEALDGAGTEAAPLVVIATTEASAPFLKSLSGPHRFILAATSDQDKDNETDFPLAFSKALASDASDSNRDGIVSLTELFQATSAGVHQIYDAGQFMLKEHAQLDGDGDGKGTQRPAASDAAPASAIGLKLLTGTHKFD